MIKFVGQVEEILKMLMVPGALFEEMGFTYVGPLEGHNLNYLIKNFETSRNGQPHPGACDYKKRQRVRIAEEDPRGLSRSVSPL